MFYGFSEPLQKHEILKWYKRACDELELRATGSSRTFPGVRMSGQDLQAYHRSVEALFLRLKKRFNRELKERAQNSNTGEVGRGYGRV